MISIYLSTHPSSFSISVLLVLFLLRSLTGRESCFSTFSHLTVGGSQSLSHILAHHSQCRITHYRCSLCIASVDLSRAPCSNASTVLNIWGRKENAENKRTGKCQEQVFLALPHRTRYLEEAPRIHSILFRIDYGQKVRV